MKQGDFQETLNRIVAEDHRYDEHAYHFLREALDFTIKLLDKPHEGKGRHVSGASCWKASGSSPSRNTAPWP
jgi:uncharacterized repeat protein (TIGR04138 family)